MIEHKDFTEVTYFKHIKHVLNFQFYCFYSKENFIYFTPSSQIRCFKFCIKGRISLVKCQTFLLIARITRRIMTAKYALFDLKLNSTTCENVRERLLAEIQFLLCMQQFIHTGTWARIVWARSSFASSNLDRTFPHKRRCLILPLTYVNACWRKFFLKLAGNPSGKCNRERWLY